MFNFATMNLRTISQLGLVIWILFTSNACSGRRITQPDSVKGLRVGFWNLENLYDTKNDPWNDDDFTPEGSNFWDATRYSNKLGNLCQVIDSLGVDILGVCEVENLGVLKDLAARLKEKGKNYEIVHFDSPDERGIDAGLYFNPAKVRLIFSEPIPVVLGEKDKTRDILHARFVHIITGDTLHYFVNHWPSRRGGQQQSAEKRAMAAQCLNRYLQGNNLLSKSVVVVGDFNDNPWDSSIQKVLGACKPAKKASCNLYNLGAFFTASGKGTLKFGNSWDIFDQIMISGSLWNEKGRRLKFKPYSNRIYAPEWMLQKGGKFDGHPLRTFGGKSYLNGYSDHLPVTADLQYD
jgi:predicted extracellular nuclease